MPHFVCMECRTRFDSKLGADHECPNCGHGRELSLEDPRAMLAPTGMRILAVLDAGYTAALAVLGITMLLIASNPGDATWQDWGLAEDLNPNPDGKVFPGAGVTEWPGWSLALGGGILIVLFILHALMIAGYMRPKKWGHTMRLVLGGMESLGALAILGWIFFKGRGLLANDEAVAIAVLLTGISIYATFAVSQSRAKEWVRRHEE